MPLGLPVVPRRVEQEQQLLGVHRLGGAVGGGAVHQVVVPVVATLDHVDVVAAALDDHDVFDRGGVRRRPRRRPA